MVREAAARQLERAARRGDGAAQRIEILRLRFEEGLPVRDIARRLGQDASRAHHEYAKARREFHEALLEVVLTHHPGAVPEEIEEEARRILEALT